MTGRADLSENSSPFIRLPTLIKKASHKEVETKSVCVVVHVAVGLPQTCWQRR